MKAHYLLFTALTLVSLEAQEQNPYFDILKHAKNGHPDAQYDLAKGIREGNQFVEKDIKLSFELFHKSAKKNNPKAMYEVANAFRYGLGVKASENWAAYYYKEAAKRGHIEAHKMVVAYYTPQAQQFAMNN